MRLEQGLGLFLQHLHETEDSCALMNLVTTWLEGWTSSCQAQEIPKLYASKQAFLCAMQLEKTQMHNRSNLCFPGKRALLPTGLPPWNLELQGYYSTSRGLCQ